MLVGDTVIDTSVSPEMTLLPQLPVPHWYGALPPVAVSVVGNPEHIVIPSELGMPVGGVGMGLTVIVPFAVSASQVLSGTSIKLKTPVFVGAPYTMRVSLFVVKA